MFPVTPIGIFEAALALLVGGFAVFFLDKFVTSSLRFDRLQRFWRMDDEQFWNIYAPRDAAGVRTPASVSINFVDMVLWKEFKDLGIDEGKRWNDIVEQERTAADRLAHPRPNEPAGVTRMYQQMHHAALEEQRRINERLDEILSRPLAGWRRTMVYFVLRHVEKLQWIGTEEEMKRQIVRSRILGEHNSENPKWWYLRQVGTETFGQLVPYVMHALALVCVLASLVMGIAMYTPGASDYHLGDKIVAKAAAEKINERHQEDAKRYPEEAVLVPKKETVEIVYTLCLVAFAGFWLILKKLETEYNEQTDRQIAAGQFPQYRICLTGYVSFNATNCGHLMWGKKKYASLSSGAHFVTWWFRIFSNPDDPGTVRVSEVIIEGDKEVRKQSTQPADKDRVLGTYQPPVTGARIILELGDREGDFQAYEADRSRDPVTGAERVTWRRSDMKVTFERNRWTGQMLDPDIGRVHVMNELPDVFADKFRSALQSALDAASSYVPEDIPDANLMFERPVRSWLLRDERELPFPFSPQVHQDLVTRLIVKVLGFSEEGDLGLGTIRITLGNAFFNTVAEAARDKLYTAARNADARRQEAAGRADATRTEGKARADVLGDNLAPAIEKVKNAVGDGSTKSLIATGIAALSEVIAGVRDSGFSFGGKKKDNDAE